VQARFRSNKRAGITILRQLSSALAYLHDNGVTHRDIKPENILVQNKDPLFVKLADFGLAASGAMTTICGSPLYIAPEVTPKRAYTHAVDIWSLGVVSLEISYGLPLDIFKKGNTLQKGIIKHVQDQCGIFADILKNMLVYSPRRRVSAKSLERSANCKDLDVEAQDCLPKQRWPCTETSENGQRNAQGGKVRVEAPVEQHTKNQSVDIEEAETIRLSNNKRSAPVELEDIEEEEALPNKRSRNERQQHKETRAIFRNCELRRHQVQLGPITRSLNISLVLR